MAWMVKGGVGRTEAQATGGGGTADHFNIAYNVYYVKL